jgi:hypothetical protein
MMGHDADILNECAARQHRFDLIAMHLLAGIQHADVLAAAGDPHVPLAIDAPQIAGLEPFPLKRFPRRLRGLPVALRHVGTAHDELALLGWTTNAFARPVCQALLRARESRPDGAPLGAERHLSVSDSHAMLGTRKAKTRGMPEARHGYLRQLPATASGRSQRGRFPADTARRCSARQRVKRNTESRPIRWKRYLREGMRRSGVNDHAAFAQVSQRTPARISAGAHRARPGSDAVQAEAA